MHATVAAAIAAVEVVLFGEHHVALFVVVVINPLYDILFQKPIVLKVHRAWAKAHPAIGSIYKRFYRFVQCPTLHNAFLCTTIPVPPPARTHYHIS
jgi:hypothetical protein